MSSSREQHTQRNATKHNIVNTVGGLRVRRQRSTTVIGSRRVVCESGKLPSPGKYQRTLRTAHQSGPARTTRPSYDQAGFEPRHFKINLHLHSIHYTHDILRNATQHNASQCAHVIIYKQHQQHFTVHVHVHVHVHHAIIIYTIYCEIMFAISSLKYA